MRPPPHRRWTREQVLALPDDGYRYELIDGQLLVSPNERANHNRAIMELIRQIDPYVERHRIGELLTGPADLDLFAGQRMQPDLFVIPYRNGERFSDWPDAGIPILVVEVAPMDTWHIDRGPKRERYLRSGVPAYWLVEFDQADQVEVWTPESPTPVVEKERLVWQPIEAIPPLEIDLRAFYRRLYYAEPPSPMGTP